MVWNENWQNFTMRGPALGVERCWRNGMRSVTTIATKLESTKGAVSHALSRLRQKGAISEAPAAGRPRISTVSENQRLAQLLNEKPLNWLRSKWGVNCSARTFKRRADEVIGWARFRAMRKTPLQERHREPRVKWARDHQN